MNDSILNLKVGKREQIPMFNCSKLKEKDMDALEQIFKE
jgi:hypothetical protein